MWYNRRIDTKAGHSLEYARLCDNDRDRKEGHRMETVECPICLGLGWHFAENYGDEYGDTDIDIVVDCDYCEESGQVTQQAAEDVKGY